MKLLYVLLIAFVAKAETVPDRYIVELSSEPAGKSLRRNAVRSEQNRVRALLEEQAVRVLDSVDTVANALIVETSDPVAISAIPGVARVTPVPVFKLYLDRAVLLQHVSDAWSSVGGMNAAGQGIKIGFIDTGIDSSHPGFQDTSLPPVEGFPKVNRETDLTFTNSKVIVARNYDRSALSSARDAEGHGTSVAMVAAGVTNSGPRGSITGVAPKAYVGNYKVFPDGRNGAPGDSILKAIDDAVLDGMDVINLSLGFFPAPRPSGDPFATAVERATQAGVIVVIAAGNQGPNMNTIGSPGTAPSAITVGNAYTDRVFSASAWLEGASPYLSVPGNGPNTTAILRAPLVDISALDGDGLACRELPGASLQGKIALILRGTCLFEQKINFAAAAGASAALIYTHSDSPDASTMSVGSASLPAAMIGNADGLDARTRLRSSPGLEVSLNFSTSAVMVNPSRLGNSTSKGPNTDFAIKPDLLGVGTSVSTAAPTHAGSYTVVSGTSLSSPMVAGAAAVLKAARPGLSVQQYRSLLINTAGEFVLDSGKAVQQTGSGLLHLANALKSRITATPATISFGSTSGTLDQAQQLALSNVGSQGDLFSISVVPAQDGATPIASVENVRLEPGATQSLSLRFWATALTPRAYEGFIVVRGTASDVETRVPYWLAVPSETARVLSVIDPPTSGRTLSTQEFFVRVLDASGVALNSQPSVSIISGGASIVSVDSYDSEYPGMYRVQVRLGELPGDNVFALEAAGAVTRLTINGR